MRLLSKVALGAARGIGEAIAFAREGASVWLTDIRDENCRRVITRAIERKAIP